MSPRGGGGERQPPWLRDNEAEQTDQMKFMRGSAVTVAECIEGGQI